MQIQLQLHYITQHYTTLITLHYVTTATTTTLHDMTLHYNYNYTYSYSYNYNYNYATLHDNTLDYTIPRYSTQHCSTLHYNTLHYSNYTTPQLQLQLQLQLRYANYTTLQLQLTTTTYNYYTYSYNYYTYSYNCTSPHYIQQGDRCNHCNHSRKHNSNHLSVHQWIHFAIRESQQPTLPIGFLFLKLPQPPCAVLLVSNLDTNPLFHIVPFSLWIFTFIMIPWDLGPRLNHWKNTRLHAIARELLEHGHGLRNIAKSNGASPLGNLPEQNEKQVNTHAVAQIWREQRSQTRHWGCTSASLCHTNPHNTKGRVPAKTPSQTCALRKLFENSLVSETLSFGQAFLSTRCAA